MQCPQCYAPEGMKHGSDCPQYGTIFMPGNGNGNGHDRTVAVQTRYKDSKNKNSFADGLEFQDFIIESVARACGFIIQQYASKYYQIKRGESIQRCEIKLDNLCTRTGRLSIEVSEKTNADQDDYMPSGIFSPTQPLFYIQGNRERSYLFATKDLVTYSINAEYHQERTITAFYMPFDDADKLCIICLTPEHREV